MNPFDKNTLITFSENNVNSIKNALFEYQNLLYNNQAFLSHDFHHIFDVEFRMATKDGPRRLQTSDTKHTDMLKQALSIGPESTWTSKPLSDEDDIYISEPIFFAIALEYEELLPDVVKTAEAIVATMRKHNNTDDVWADDMHIFGVEALYLLAIKHPQYTYLLGHFFIPYWDLEHAAGYENYLFSLVAQRGWTKDLIKAFIWCDNGHFRYHMFSTGDYFSPASKANPALGEFLKQNPDAYKWFKESITERFRKEPALLYPNDVEIADKNPILDIFITLQQRNTEYFEDEEEDNEELLQAHFIVDTLENEALDLQEHVAHVVNAPLARYDEKNQLSRECSEFFERDVYRGEGTKDLKELMLALPNGGQIWNYIEKGTNTEILEQINKLPLVPLAKTKAKHFYCRLTYFTNPLDYEGDINNQLHNILSDVTYDHFYEDDENETADLGNGFISKTWVSDGSEGETKAEQKQKSAQYLRILDVFFRLLDVEELNSAIQEIVIGDQDNPLLTQEEFYRRYSKKGTFKEKKLKLNNRSFGSEEYYIDKDTLKYIERVIKQNGREAFDCASWGQPTLGSITMAAYLLSKDRAEMFFDDYTKKLMEYVGKGPWLSAFEQIHDSLDTEEMRNEELSLLKDYITSPTQPQASHEEILKLFQTYLYREECYRRGNLGFNKFSKNQPSYDFLSDDDGFQHVILCCYWMQNFMPPLGLQANRLWKLLLDLAPQRVIRLIGKLFSDDYSVVEFEDTNREERFYSDLEHANIPKEQIYAFQMAQAQEKQRVSDPCDTQTYLTWLDLYDDIDDEDAGMIGAYRRNKALAFEKGMHFINEKARIRYYADLSLRNPRFPFQQDEDFKRCLNIFVQLNIIENASVSPDTLTENLLSYINGHTSYEPIKEAFGANIRTSDMMIVLEELSMYSLPVFIWLLENEQQNRLIRLLVNHSYEGYKIIKYDLFYAYLRELVKSGDISIEDYLDTSPEQSSNDVDKYETGAYEWLNHRLQKLDIRKDYYLHFLLGKDIPVHQSIIAEMVRKGETQNMISKLSVSQRIKLAQILEKENDAKALLGILEDDPSRKVKSIIKSIRKNIK